MCSCCGRPFELAPQVEKAPGLCRLCRASFYAFERAGSFAYYNDALAGAIVLLKYEEVTRLGHWFAERLAEVIRNEERNFKPTRWFPSHCIPIASTSGATTRRN
jgi:predicted amidophosphoribosyltransferase